MHDNFLDKTEIVLDIEHPPELRPFEPGFRLSWVGLYDGTTIEILRPDDAKPYLDGCKEQLLVGHEIKYDISCLHSVGLLERSFDCVADTMVGMNVLNENIPDNELGLKALVSDLFDRTRPKFDPDMDQDSEEFKQYLKDDLTDTWELWQSVKKELREQGLEKYFHNCLMCGFPAVADMQIAGFAWDFRGAVKMIIAVMRQRQEAEKVLRKRFGETLNLRSDDQLAEILYDKLKLNTKGIAKTKTRLSVDKKAIERLVRQNPGHKDLEQLIKFRTANKLIGTYLIPISLKALNNEDRRVHSDFWMTSLTGRLRCEKPSMFNIPVLKGLKVRDQFIASDGHKLVVIDWSQEELRIMAHVSGDKNLIHAYTHWACKGCGADGFSVLIMHTCPACGCGEPDFWHGEDIHTNTLKAIPILRTRDNAKTVNFACIYGAGAKTLHSRHPELSLPLWEQARSSFLNKLYPGVGQYHVRQREALLTTRTVKGILGRRRRFTEKQLATKKWYCINAAYNAPIQMSGAGLMYLGIARCRDAFIERGWWGKEVKLVNAVHDEPIFDARKDLVADVQKIAVEILENVVALKVPLRVDVHVAERWGDCK